MSSGLNMEKNLQSQKEKYMQNAWFIQSTVTAFCHLTFSLCASSRAGVFPHWFTSALRKAVNALSLCGGLLVSWPSSAPAATTGCCLSPPRFPSTSTPCTGARVLLPSSPKAAFQSRAPAKENCCYLLLLCFLPHFSFILSSILFKISFSFNSLVTDVENRPHLSIWIGV